MTKLIAPGWVQSLTLFLALLSQLGAKAQPEDWIVTPSAFEFSMTLTFTVAVDGLVGAENGNAAAIFDASGTCRGWGITDFQATTGYYTGLILVYSNVASEPGLEVRVWDAELDSLPGCLDEVDFVANGSLGSLSDPVVFYGVYDPLVGCTDPGACNFLSTAITDNGSCIYPGCSLEAACNYVASSPCYDDATCIFPEPFLDCDGQCLNDFDGDGICDELEIGGCTDDRACNYDSTATDDDCSCNFPFYPLDCNGNCYLDTDGDGVCEADEISGCDDPISCNFDPAATDNDGSCVYCCYSIYGAEAGYSVEVERFAGLGTETAGLPGLTTFRIYLTCPDAGDRVTGVSGSYGNSTFISSESGFYQSPNGGLTISDIDSSAFANMAEVALDSWLTIGLDHPSPGPGESIIEATSGLWANLFELGEDLFIGGVSNDGWSISDSGTNGLAGSDLKVLLGQFTTAIPIEGSLNVTVIPAGASSPILITPLFVAPPCGCMDDAACNYDASVTYDDESCTYPAAGLNCEGQCTFDSDGDGVCDEDEIVGCTDFNAANFNGLATDDGECLYPGCTYPTAENFMVSANVDDGSCAFALSNDCPTDINGDGLTAASDILEILSSYGTPCQ